MAHSQQLSYIQTVRNACLSDTAELRIIEIGSYDVNGNIRKIFDNSKQYIGVDLTEGPGVDLVCSGDKVDYQDGYFDVAISCECFEHNPKWIDTFSNMIRMVKPGGIVIMTCASTGRKEHGTIRTDPSISPGTFAVGIDYYKNLTRKDFLQHFHVGELFSSHVFYYNRRSKDLYFVGYKKVGNSDGGDLRLVNRIFDSKNTQSVRQKGWLHWFMVKMCDVTVKAAEAIFPDIIFEKYIRLMDKAMRYISS
jgi:SAM-dependent methyltransferase